MIAEKEQESGPAHRTRAWQPAVAILGTALAAAAILGVRGNSCGDDFNFHLLSWMEAARSWQSGVWYPHWIHLANYGAGEPRLVFYPPASWMLGGLLGWASSWVGNSWVGNSWVVNSWVVNSWSAAPILFVLLALVACGGSMYRLAREWAPPGPATVAACLYTANPYALFLIYQRSALAELLAAACIPVIALFALKRDASVGALGMAVAAVWLTNAPAAVMASYLLALIALAMALLEGKAWPVWRAAGGMALGLGLAAFYIAPAFYEQRWVEIQRTIAPGLRIEDSFLFMRTGDSYHDHVLGLASWIVCAETAAAAIAVWLAWRARSGPLFAKLRSAGTRMHVQLLFAALVPLLLFLQFPWSAGVWNHAPWLKFVQFPWRWLTVLAMAASMLIALALGRGGAAPTLPCSQRRFPPWLKATGAGLVFVSLLIGAELLFFQRCDSQDAVSAQVSAFHGDPAMAHVEGTDEYTPRGADSSKIEQGLPLVRVLGNTEARATVEQDRPEHWVIRVESSTPGYAVLRLMDYPAWQVTRNGQRVGPRPQRADGLMAVPVVRGANEIDVRWGNTADVLAGRALSGIALVWLAAGFIRDLRRRRHPIFHRVS